MADGCLIKTSREIHLRLPTLLCIQKKTLNRVIFLEFIKNNILLEKQAEKPFMNVSWNNNGHLYILK